MKKGWQETIIRLAVIVLVMWSFSSPAQVHASCATGSAVPPFLAAGLDHNLLLLIDNSASMYDLAYVRQREEGYCYDGLYTDSSGTPVESYSAAKEYAGYFDATAWYAYNLTSAQFETKTTAEAETICSSANYASSGTACIAIDESGSPKTVTAFAALGNFLNWAAASKLDIQKKILTGGKYDATAGQLVMESRGCLGRRFVKKIALSAAGGGTYYLTLGIRPPSDAEKQSCCPQSNAANKGDT